MMSLLMALLLALVLPSLHGGDYTRCDARNQERIKEIEQIWLSVVSLCQCDKPDPGCTPRRDRALFRLWPCPTECATIAVDSYRYAH